MTKSIYTVYQITNIINNKIYIGVHKTTNPNDDYMGSGNLIKKAIQKHGKENFNKTILYEYNTSMDAYLKESQIVTESFVKNHNNYNICCGGNIPPFHLGKIRSDETKSKISKARSGMKFTKEHKLNMSKSRLNIKQTKEHKQKISNSNKGIKNNQFSGYFITPHGKFESSKLASTNRISSSSIRKWCKNPNLIIDSVYRSKYLQSLKESPIGKTFKEIGFYFEPI